MDTWRSVGSFVIFLTALGFIFASPAQPAQKKPATAAEIALYNGADRQQILEEGARKEGKIVYYTTGILQQSVRPVIQAFNKKYPYIKVDIWRASNDELTARFLTERKADKYLVDAIEVNQATIILYRDLNYLQPFHSPQLPYFEDEGIVKGPGGAAYGAGIHRTDTGLGYNTKMISFAEIPKTYKELLDPKWKGHMPLSGSRGAALAGHLLDTYGEEFVKRLGEQEFVIHMVSARAICDMIINGEYRLSPSVAQAHVIESAKGGAPVAWYPLSPAYSTAVSIGLPKNAPNPHATMLFIDFQLTKEVEEIRKTVGYDGWRKDVAPLSNVTYKRSYGAESLEAMKKEQEIFNRYFLKK